MKACRFYDDCFTCPYPDCIWGTNGDKTPEEKMAFLLCVPVDTISYDANIDALACQCGCGMEISVRALKGLQSAREWRVYKDWHKALKARAQ